MSIYPVRAKTWFVAHKEYEPECKRDIKFERDLIKSAIKNGCLTCITCGKKIKDYKKCYISHAFAYGYGDTNYCDKECFSKRGRR